MGNYYYGPGHPMKPHRIRMANNLLVNYGLYKHMSIYVILFQPQRTIITHISLFGACSPFFHYRDLEESQKKK